ncbi:MAG: chemotaxis protein CheA [Leptospira sp.]|nr:chemotaxis protein CheA [Leptospira sp.]
MSRDRNDVLEFLIEAREILTAIEEGLLSFEKNLNSGARPDKEILNTLFRHFHTIKGSSGFFGLTGIVKVAHAAENLLDFLRNNPESQDNETLELLIEGHDTLVSLVDEEQNNPSDGDIHSEAQFSYITKVNYKNETIRSNIPMISPLSKVETEEFGIFLPPKTDQSEVIKEEFGLFSESKKETEEFGLFGNNNTQNQEFGLFEAKVIPQKVEEFGLFTQNITEIKSNSNSEATKILNNTPIKSDIRIDTDKLDALLDIVGEIVINEPMVTNHPELSGYHLDNFHKTAIQLKKLVKQLQEITLSLRMVPISGVFSKMERLVRDTAKKTNKLVELHISGEDTEIDKTIIEKIYDPLVHILRNAIDHGLETLDERKEAGKNTTGNIYLEAMQSGKEVWISASDDGKGLSKEKIINKAKKLGLIPYSTNEDSMSDNEVWDFLFNPGFSTAEFVTDLSGRGVGLDVVKKNVTALNGFINVSSSFGQGTTFLIRLPLTLAIIEGMVVQRKDDYFILPTIDVKETLYLKNDQFKEIYHNNFMFAYRNEMIPIADLDLLFGLESSLYNFEPKSIYVIIVENGDKKIGIPFDLIIGNQSIVIKPLSPIFKNINGLAGCTILGNGQAGLILDVRKLVSNYFQSDLSKVLTHEI